MSARDAALDELAEALWRDEVVALPTDTVYGLAVRAASPDAAAALFAVKRRPDRVALPVLVADLAQALELAELPVDALGALARRFWPGPLTLVVRRARHVVLHLGGDETTIGLRCPQSPVLRALATEVGPLAVTSANLHGDRPCTSAQEVRAAFGPALRVLDGGRCDARPSSVVSLLDERPELLRPGPVTLAEVLAALRG